MAERADASRTDPEHEQGHRHERPEDWGWHGSWGNWARVAGWLSAVLLLLLNFTWYYNQSADPWIFGTAALLVVILLRDRHRRKNAWRGE